MIHILGAKGIIYVSAVMANEFYSHLFAVSYECTSKYIAFSVKPALYSVTYGIKPILFSSRSASIYDVMWNVFRH